MGLCKYDAATMDTVRRLATARSTSRKDAANECSTNESKQEREEIYESRRSDETPRL